MATLELIYNIHTCICMQVIMFLPYQLCLSLDILVMILYPWQPTDQVARQQTRDQTVARMPAVPRHEGKKGGFVCVLQNIIRIYM